MRGSYKTATILVLCKLKGLYYAYLKDNEVFFHTLLLQVYFRGHLIKYLA